MTGKLNPFARLVADNLSPAETEERPRYPTDDPGREYDRSSSEAPEQTRSSGVSAPSEPRRPGGGTRQAPRRQSEAPLDEGTDPLIPGEILYGEGDVVINEGMEVTTIRVANTSDRPIQIGSHFHFAEVNPALQFDRAAAWGKRLAVLSGGAERFEPGAVEEVELVPIMGRRVVLGLRGECRGGLDDAKD
ncbi:Urease subunit beta [Jannaschia rubra]|uniref:Urease subunit beta n=1 Tax=Jannaschia rubra TaxID=282197 RepID=A0A0M6XJQ0_9RHOB|nr:Urease subunit beta [Jannaschia rubra]SFF79690.1 urease subunit beta [Jannaschia rubra]